MIIDDMKENKNIHIEQIFIELTNLCNFNCIFCTNDKMSREKQFMDPILAKRLIDEIADNRISQKIAFFLMGEPLLYPNIFEILRYAVDKNIKVTVNTNASLLSRDNIDELLKIPLDILVVSLQTSTAESFRLRRGGPNITYESYIDGIKALLRRKVEIGGDTTLSILFMDTGLNLTQLFLSGSNTVKMELSRKHAKMLADELFKVIREAQKKPYDLEDNFHNLSKNITFKRLILGNCKIKVSREIEFIFCGVHNWGEVMVDGRVLPAAFGSCNALTEQFVVLCNGDYSLCCKDYNGDLVIGNAYKQSLVEILTSEKAQRIKKDFRLCRLPFKRCRICRGGTNIPEWVLKQIFTSIVYNVPVFMRFLKKLILA